jgi:hypothetical protein
MSLSSPEDIGRELSDLAFGIIEQNWLELHLGKVLDLKSLPNLDAAEWELTYLIFFAITNGCAAVAPTDSERATAILKSFHAILLRQIADQAGQDITDAHRKNLPARYRLYGDAIKGETKNGPYTLLGQAAALQILGDPIEDPARADLFRETIKVIFTEVRDAAIKVVQ